MVEGAFRGRLAKAPAPEEHPRPRERLRALRRDEHGTAVVEFALVAPILFLLMFGILDFGRVLNYYNQESQLAGLGARAAAVNRNPDGVATASGTSIQTQLVNTYAKGELNGKMTACISEPSGQGVGKPVTVTTHYNFHFLPLIGAALRLGASPTIDISTSQTVRQEVAPTYATGGTGC
jgi:Flp pilus assembly protein TadG